MISVPWCDIMCGVLRDRRAFKTAKRKQQAKRKAKAKNGMADEF